MIFSPARASQWIHIQNNQFPHHVEIPVYICEQSLRHFERESSARDFWVASIFNILDSLASTFRIFRFSLLSD